MIALEPATRDDRAAVENLMQLYAYDWSEFGPYEVDDRGRFADYPSLGAYWTEPGRHPFLLKLDARLVGFALILETSRLTGTAGVYDMAEFFVLRRYRRRGLGSAAACAAFDRFRGPWEVRQRAANPAAIAFWRRTIGGYTQQRYREVLWNDAAWNGPVQSFTSVG